MLKNIRNIIDSKSDFTKNFFILFKGTVIAQIIPMVLTPVLTRLYTPEDFGILELFVSVISILGAIANFRYELSVVLPDRKEDAWNLMGFGFLISIIFSLFTLLVIGLFADEIAGWLNNSKVKFWLYFVPITVVLQGFFNMLSYYNTREKLYKNISNASIFRSSSRTLIQIIIGLFKKSPAGLIIGQTAGYAASLFPLSRKINFKVFLKKISWENMKTQAYKYRDFAIYTMPSTLANTTAVNMTGVLISSLYNINSVGFYSLANRILGLPSAIIGTSMSNVFYKEAHDQLKKFGNAKEVYLNTLKKLVLVSLPVIFIILFAGETLFAFVFGEEWRIAGRYAKILIPLIMVRFVFAPISVSLAVFERQKLMLYWQLVLLVLTILTFVITYLLGWNIELFLVLTSIVLTLYYIYLIFLLYKVVSGKK